MYCKVVKLLTCVLLLSGSIACSNVMMAKPTSQTDCMAGHGLATGAGHALDCPVNPSSTPATPKVQTQAERIAAAWPHSVSVGRPNRGALINPVKLTSDHTLSSRKYKNYGTQELVDIIRAATHAVHAKHKNSPRIHVGDLSRKKGGRFRPHVSHQSGRDVDIGYYMLEGQRANRLQKVKRRNLDIPRTWTMMESFLRSGQIQYMFSHRGFIPALRRYAKRQPHITEDELLEWFGNKKRRGLIRHLKGHDCHLHIRIYAPDSLAANEEYIRRHGEDALRAHIRSIPIRSRVRRGDTLKSIAGRAGISVKELKKLNKMKRKPKRLYRGRRLVIGHRHPWDRQPPSYVLYQRRLAKKARRAKARMARLLVQETNGNSGVAKPVTTSRDTEIQGASTPTGLAKLPAQDLRRLLALSNLMEAKVVNRLKVMRVEAVERKPVEAKRITIQVIAKRNPSTPGPKPQLATAVTTPTAAHEKGATQLTMDVKRIVGHQSKLGKSHQERGLGRPLAYFLRLGQNHWKQGRRTRIVEQPVVDSSLVAFLKPQIVKAKSSVGQAVSPAKALEKKNTNATRDSVALKTAGHVKTVSPIKVKMKHLQPVQIAQAVGPKATPSILNYKVQKGDSLWRIARKFKISMPELCRSNQIQPDCSISGLKRGTRAILPGRVLQIAAPKRRG
ncbi:MAG: penicillin-insensitive murein endopeptidase [Myxococcota bacterium]|nr:penicillin-insensitive murein endopeptidase [Myxococcota bacterium]